MKFASTQNNVVRLSSGVKVSVPDASRALEEAWLKRRRELGTWQPSNGWLVEQKPLTRRLSLVR